MLENRLHSKRAANLAVNHPSNTLYLGVTFCLESNNTDKLVANHPLKKQSVLVGGWHIQYLSYSTGRIKNGCCDLLMRLFWKRYQISQAPGMSDVECSRGSDLPRSAW